MESPLFRIVYCSRNVLAEHGGERELDGILLASRRNNALDDVTGALLYTDGMFCQTLEGPFEAVQTVFERIQGDPRHDDIVVLQADSVSERIFGEWSMAHAEPHDPAHARAVLSTILANGESKDFDAVLALLDRVVRRERAA